MDRTLLERTLAELGEPAYRTEQIGVWLSRGAASFSAMTNLPAALREELEQRVALSTLNLEEQSRSTDGTLKALMRTREGHAVEAVLMRFRDGRRSVCVSSQSGCPLTCTFCATGRMRFARNLSVDEIVDQALHFRRLGPLDHAVFMGMGEPMLNLDAVLGACELLPSLGITHRRTTISTAGWIPGIERIATCGMPMRLALSLHAPEDSLRSELMPINDRYPLADVLAAMREHHRQTRRRVYIEYVMLAGVNDRYEQATALAALLVPREAFKVNLIPFNPTDPSLRGSSREAIAAFRDVLARSGVHVTVRLTRGRDIAAACGQLAAGAVAVGG